MLAEHQPEIQAERDRKLSEVRFPPLSGFFLALCFASHCTVIVVDATEETTGTKALAVTVMVYVPAGVLSVGLLPPHPIGKLKPASMAPNRSADSAFPDCPLLRERPPTPVATNPMSGSDSANSRLEPVPESNWALGPVVVTVRVAGLRKATDEGRPEHSGASGGAGCTSHVREAVPVPLFPKPAVTVDVEEAPAFTVLGVNGVTMTQSCGGL